MELKGKTALITGASGKLGLEIAKSLAAAGLRCVLHCNRNLSVAQATADKIRHDGGEAVVVRGDLCTPGFAEDIIDSTAEFGIAQILINSAAAFARRPLEDVSEESFLQMLAMNAVAPVMMCRAFAKAVQVAYGKQDGVVGKIVNLTDIGAFSPWKGYVEYCSSKAALVCATGALAKELAPKICVNSVVPGLIDYPVDMDESQKVGIIQRIPLGRRGTSGEVFGAIKFLLENDYLTGETIKVDGGRSI